MRQRFLYATLGLTLGVLITSSVLLTQFEKAHNRYNFLVYMAYFTACYETTKQKYICLDKAKAYTNDIFGKQGEQNGKK